MVEQCYLERQGLVGQNEVTGPSNLRGKALVLNGVPSLSVGLLAPSLPYPTDRWPSFPNVSVGQGEIIANRFAEKSTG